MYTTDAFELMLLSTIVKDTTVFNKVVGIADYQLFSSSLSAEIYDIIKVFNKEYARVPSQDEILHIYKRDRTVTDDTTVTHFLNVIFSRNVDVKFVTDELTKYVKLKKLENLHKTAFEQLKSGQDVDVSSTVADMFKIQMESIQDKHIYGVNIDESEYMSQKDSLRNYIPTNIHFLNGILNGGLAGGQLGVILAPPNYGKTMSLLNFAIYAWLKKNNVLFVTLEMPEFSIAKRINMLLSGALDMSIGIDTIKKISAKVDKKFMLLYRPVKSISVDYLYSVFHQATADGVNFDIIFIDYADLLTTASKQKEKRFELAEIFASLKSFSQVLNIPVWSATQSNREGLRADVVDMSHMSESIDKAFISDVVLSLSEKVEANKVSKLFLTKHREGVSDKYIDIQVDKNMWFSDSDQIGAVGLDHV